MNERELNIASVAASIASGCLPCLQYYKTKSYEFGLKKEEIYEICNTSLKIRNEADKHNRLRIDVILEGKSNEDGFRMENDDLITDCNCGC